MICIARLLRVSYRRFVLAWPKKIRHITAIIKDLQAGFQGI